MSASHCWRVDMTNHHSRRGVALLLILVVLAVISFLLASITVQTLVNRRTIEQRQHQVQANWLARSGLEVAVARLHNTTDYTGEALEIIPDSQVIVQIEPMIGSSRTITAEARFPHSQTRLSVVKLSRRY